MLVITQALVLCLMYMHLPSGTACPWASCVYIGQSSLAFVITYTNNTFTPQIKRILNAIYKSDIAQLTTLA